MIKASELELLKKDEYSGYFKSIIDIRGCHKLSRDARKVCQELWFTQGHGYHHSVRRISPELGIKANNVYPILDMLQRIGLVSAYQKGKGRGMRRFYRLKLFQHCLYGDGSKEPSGVGEMWLFANPGYEDVTKYADEVDFKRELSILDADRKKAEKSEWMRRQLEQAVGEKVDW